MTAPAAGPVLRYDPEVLARFPATRAGVAVAEGVVAGPTPPGLLDAFRAEQAVALERLGARSPGSLTPVAAWRRTFSAFGVEPTRYRNAIEALLRRLQKTGEVPSLGLLVDLGNLVSIRHTLPVVLVDLDRVAGGLTVRFARGDERFDDLGGTEAEHPNPGEVIFVDEDGEVAARRWCWRQSTRSAVSGSTRRVLLAVEAQHEGADDEVAAALASAAELLRACSADVRTARLGPARPSW